MTFKNKKLQKFISCLIVIAILAPSLIVLVQPKKAEAQFVVANPFEAVLQFIGNAFTGTGSAAQVGQTAISIKEVAKDIGKQLLMAVAKKALSSLTKSTVNWINTGFHGSPLFVENPLSFFKDITKSRIEDFITMTGYNQLKYPFGKQYAISLIYRYNDSLESDIAYSMSNISNDPAYLANLRGDFNTGGWNAFFMNSQVPQNNPIGYTLKATQNLVTKVAAKEKKITDALQQGSGFLSPQTCPSNPKYNPDVNEFKKPAFTAPKYDSDNVPVYDGTQDLKEFKAEEAAYNAAYEKSVTDAKKAWSDINVCPYGLVNTTPGSVAAGLALRSISTTFAQSELGAALGNSLSAVFNSLITHFTDRRKGGLNTLASNTNTSGSSSSGEFTYEGLTLGSPVSGTNPGWDSGPDEPLDLPSFNREVQGGDITTTDDNGVSTTEHVPGGIELVQQELYIISHNVNGELGVIEIMDKNWQKIKELDQCQPGPDKGWEQRLTEEQQSNSTVIQEQLQDYSKEAQGSLRGLKIAVQMYKDWLNEKMAVALPSSILYLDAIQNIDSKFQTMSDMADRAKTLRQTLARLQAIKTALDPFMPLPRGTGTGETPEAGTLQEKNLVAIRKKYKAIKDDIPSSITIENTRSILDKETDNEKNTLALTDKCINERKAAGYTGKFDQDGFLPKTAPLPAKGTLPSLTTLAGTIYKKILILTVDNQTTTKMTLLGPVGSHSGDRKSWNTPFGPRLSWDTPDDKNNNAIIWSRPVVTTGKEIEQYCELPVVSGFSHESLSHQDDDVIPATESNTDLNGNTTTIETNADGSTTTTVKDSSGTIISGPTTTPANQTVKDNLFREMTMPVLHTDLPVINAVHLFHHEEDGKLWHWVNIEIDCKVVYTANTLNYKKAGDVAF